MGQSLATLKLEIQAEVAAAEANIKSLGKTGQAVTDRLAEDFERLSLKSSMALEQEYRAAVASYTAIRGSGVASATEISRAQDALQTKLRSLDAAINPGKAAIRELNNEIRSLQSTGQAVTDRLATHFERLKISTESSLQQQKAAAVASYEAIKNSGVASAKEIARAHEALTSRMKDLDHQINSSGTKVHGLGSTFSNVGGALSALGIGVAAFSLVAITQQLHQAGMAAERLKNALEVTAGGMTAGSNAMAFIRGESNRLGIELQSSAMAYMKLSAASKETALEGEKTKVIFSAVAGASRALSLSSEETNGALLAISQMMSKGTVQSEELRGQLGERLPGAFQIAARAMGVSTSELGKMLEQGQVISDDFLPKFAAELQKTFPAGEKAVSGMTAETERLKTAWFELKTAVMESGGETFFTHALRALSETIKEAKIDLLQLRHPLTPRTAFTAGQPLNTFDASTMGFNTPISAGTSMDYMFTAGKVVPNINPAITAKSRVVKDSASITDAQQKELTKSAKGYESELKQTEKYQKDFLAMQERWRKAEESLDSAYDKAVIATAEQQRSKELAILKNRYDALELSQTEYLDEQYRRQVEASDKQLVQLKEAAERASQAAYDAAKAVPERPMSGDPAKVDAYNQAILTSKKTIQESVEAWTRYGAAESKAVQDGIKHQGQLAANTQANDIAQLNAEAAILSMGGDIYAATLKQIEADKLGRKPIKEKTDALRDQLDALKALKAAQDETNRINAIKDQTTDINIDMMNDPYAQERAAMEERYRREAELIQQNIDLKIAAGTLEMAEYEALSALLIAKGQQRDKALVDSQREQSRAGWDAALSVAKQAVPQMAMFDKLIAAAHKDYTIKNKAGVVDETRTNLNMYGSYAGAVGGLFEGMAQAQDTSSRAGFESAKAYNIAAAVMNTASGIMNAFATSGNIYSGAAMAALVAAAGAIQIATIASTSFGGGASAPSAPSGTVATGGSSGSGTAMTGMSAAVGNPYQSIRDSQTGEQLDRIAESMGNAALAMGKISESLFDLTEYLETGFGQALIENVPGAVQTDKTTNYAYNLPDQWKTANTAFGMSFDPLSTFVSDTFLSMFGSENKVLENGVAIGLEKGITAVANGWLSREVGNRWEGSKRRNETFDIDPAYTQALQNTFNLITSAAREQVVAIGVWGKNSGSMFDTLAQGVSVASVQLDRTAEDFDEKLTAVISNIGNSIVEATFPDLAQYALPGGYETAIEILERLAVSITDVNASFAMIGKTVLESSPAMANAAYKLTELMGGSEAFSEAIDTYFTSMFTDVEQEAAQAAEAKREVNSAFTEMDSLLPKRYESILDHFDAMTNTAYMNVVESASKMPQTREEFRNLVNSLDVTTESGSALFASLMSVSEAFGLTMDAADAAAEKLREIQQATQDLDARYLKATGKSTEAETLERQLSAQREIEQAYADEMGEPYIDRLREVLAAEEQAATSSVQDMSAILSQRQSLQDQLDVLNGVRTQRDIDLAKITDTVSASLQQQVWAAQDLKTATDAAAAAEKTLAAQRSNLQDQYDIAAGIRTQHDIDLAKIEDPWSKAMQARIYGLQDEQAAITANTAALQSAVDASSTALETAKSNLQSAFDAEKERLTKAYDLELERLNANLDAASETVSRLTSYVDKLKSARESMSLDDAAYQASQYAAAQASMAALLVQARGGNLSGIETMDETLSILTKQGTDAYANSTDYQRDFWRTSNSISELENLAGNQLTDAQRANDLAQQQIDALTVNHDAQMSALDAQLDALLGLNVAAMSIADAIAGLTAAQAAYGAASAALPAASVASASVAPTKTTYSKESILSYIDDALARHGGANDAFAYDIYTRAAQYGVSSAELVGATKDKYGWAQSNFDDWVRSQGLPSFAVGTNYVPYDMTANIHEGERIIPRADNYELMQRLDAPDKSNDELKKEVRELSTKLERLLMRIADSSDRTARATNGNPDAPVLVEIAA